MMQPPQAALRPDAMLTFAVQSAPWLVRCHQSTSGDTASQFRRARRPASAGRLCQTSATLCEDPEGESAGRVCSYATARRQVEG